MVPTHILEIPQYVLLHVSKGGKFIPTGRRATSQALSSHLPTFHRQLLLRKVFPADTTQRVSRCRVSSSWQPAGDFHIDAFIRLLRDDLAEFEASDVHSNLGWMDRKAQIWLKQHRDTVCVIDCDKGLGEAIVLRSWVNEQVALQLSHGYVQLNPAELLVKMNGCKQRADVLVQFFRSSGVLSLPQARFLLSKLNSSSAGCFRILAKVHKHPVASRPVCNVRCMWFGPFNLFLVEQLNPVVNALHTVVTSTDSLLHELGGFSCKPGYRFVTLDVVNLYPSIDRQHLFQTIVPCLRRHIPDYQKCTFIIQALELVMDACIVSFNGEVYESQDGVATGLGVAGQVANIYLSSLDNFLMQSGDIYLQFLRRYIDDLLLLWSGSALDLCAIANSWHPSLKFDLSGDGNVHFLDVALHIEQNRSVSWSMYEKPLNLHLYVPVNSCHPDSVFHSLQIGGFWRCLRRNSSTVDAKRSLAAFKLRLRDRGFSIAAFERIVKRYQDRIAANQRRRNTIRQVFLKVPFNKDINVRWLHRQIHKHCALVHQAVPNIRMGLCWPTGMNLFRRRYKDVWLYRVG